MRRTACLGILCWVAAQPVLAAPVTASRLRQAADDPDAYLVDGEYLRGEGRIAAMRARGDLPDVIRAGRCTFGIAGDPGVVYYVRECN